jgi:uncharacterized protein (DUF302 family)
MGQNIGFSTKLNLDYERAVQAARAALQEEGFGVLTEIDVKTTVKQKLDKDFRRYVILRGASPAVQRDSLRGRQRQRRGRRRPPAPARGAG